MIDHSYDPVQSEINTTSDIHILDLPVDEQIASVSQIWRSQRHQLGYNPSSHNPLLKEIGDATETEITLNVDTKDIRVFGKSKTLVQQAVDRLSNLETAMVRSRSTGCLILLLSNLSSCRCSLSPILEATAIIYFFQMPLRTLEWFHMRSIQRQ